MRFIFLFLFLISFFNCTSQKIAEQVSIQKHNVDEDNNNFVAQFLEEEIKLQVTCWLDERIQKSQFEVIFKSDRSHDEDSNGDGLVVSGYLIDNKLTITIIKDSITYHTDELSHWSNSNNVFKGDGYLVEQETNEELEISFTLTCK